MTIFSFVERVRRRRVQAVAAPPPAPRLVDLLPGYADHLRYELQRRPRGARLYVYLVRRCLDHLPPDATHADLDVAAVRRIQRHFGAYCSASYVENILCGIRAFCVWGQREGWRTDDPTTEVVWPRVPIVQPDRLRAGQVRALLAALPPPAGLTALQDWRWRRNGRAVALMLYAGLRLAETAALEWRDVDLEAGEITVRSAAKFGDERIVPISRQLRRYLLAVPEAERSGGVIPCRPGGPPVTFQALENVFRRWPPVRDIHAHQLRHAFATAMHRKRVSVRTIQVLLGHKSLETTQRYLGVDPEMTAEAVGLVDW